MRSLLASSLSICLADQSTLRCASSSPRARDCGPLLLTTPNPRYIRRCLKRTSVLGGAHVSPSTTSAAFVGGLLLSETFNDYHPRKRARVLYARRAYSFARGLRQLSRLREQMVENKLSTQLRPIPGCRTIITINSRIYCRERVRAL